MGFQYGHFEILTDEHATPVKLGEGWMGAPPAPKAAGKAGRRILSILIILAVVVGAILWGKGVIAGNRDEPSMKVAPGPIERSDVPPTALPVVNAGPTGRPTPTGKVVVATPSPSLAARSVLDKGQIGSLFDLKLSGGQVIKLCYCPPGTFTMGSPKTEPERGENEGPVEVLISKGFWIAQTEMTQAQWEAVMGGNPSYFQGAKLPVETVSWDEAVACIKKMEAMVKMPAGWKLALPTEAQWEYACRAGTKTAFSFGNQLNGKEANCDSAYGTNFTGPFLDTTAGVGRYAANPWGLYDMHGNAWELCADWYNTTLSGGLDPKGPATGTDRVLRGGSWANYAGHCRAAYRDPVSPGYRSRYLGFRVVAVPAEPLMPPTSLPVVNAGPTGRPTPTATVVVVTPAPTPRHAARSVLDEGQIGSLFDLKLSGGQVIKLCYCPPGTFTMGSPKTEPERGENEGPVDVRISKGFWMAQTEMTQAQWEAVMGSNSNPSSLKGAKLPVETVSWEEAVACIKKMEGMVKMPAGWKLALPTEAQWEYACRAGAKTAFSFGNQLNGKEANCNGNYPYGTTVKGPYLEKTVEGGKYAANTWGLYDMHGNVWEWCADWFDATLSGGLDPKGPATGTDRVLRGGSWNYFARFCRAGIRTCIEPGRRNLNLGLRVVAVRQGHEGTEGAVDGERGRRAER